MLEENVVIMGKKVFYIHTDIVTKKWGKKRTKQFLLKHTNSAAKIVEEKSSGKSAKKKVFIFTRIS